MNNKCKNVDFIRNNKLFGGDLLPTGFFPNSTDGTVLNRAQWNFRYYYTLLYHPQNKNRKKTKQNKQTNKRKEKSRTVQQIVDLRN